MMVMRYRPHPTSPRPPRPPCPPVHRLCPCLCLHRRQRKPSLSHGPTASKSTVSRKVVNDPLPITHHEVHAPLTPHHPITVTITVIRTGGCTSCSNPCSCSCSCPYSRPLCQLRQSECRGSFPSATAFRRHCSRHCRR